MQTAVKKDVPASDSQSQGQGGAAPAQQAREPAEPRTIFINDVMVRLDEAFPGASDAEMPPLDSAFLPDDFGDQAQK